MTIPFIDLKTPYKLLESKIKERLNKVLEHGIYIMGPEVEELEQRLAILSGAKHCITVSSGTEALLISLLALNVKPGDEVITTPFTFIATVEAIVLLGARPIFVDIEPDTCNLDVNLLAEKITSKTKAIIPVSLYGQPCDMDEINEIALRYGGIPVIEDGAQSFGALYKGGKSCHLSTIGCTSFFPSKPLGCYGDGGAIFTDDDSFARECRQIRIHGQSERYIHTRIGVGGRMDTMQCAVVLAKLDSFNWEIQQRLYVAARYDELLDISPQGKAEKIYINRPVLRENRSSTYAQYTIQSDERMLLQERMKMAGIPTTIHYPVPVNEQPAYRHFCCENCTPKASAAARRVLSLPMSPYLSLEDQSLIVSTLFSASK